jgi:hypothetical protein
MHRTTAIQPEHTYRAEDIVDVKPEEESLFYSECGFVRVKLRDAVGGGWAMVHRAEIERSSWSFGGVLGSDVGSVLGSD